jgi:hypothetical protein
MFCDENSAIMQPNDDGEYFIDRYASYTSRQLVQTRTKQFTAKNHFFEVFFLICVSVRIYSLFNLRNGRYFEYILDFYRNGKMIGKTF